MPESAPFHLSATTNRFVEWMRSRRGAFLIPPALPVVAEGVITTRREDAEKWAINVIDRFANWSRKFSLFSYPFVTACCGMEYMSVAASRYDIARFGAEIPRFSPRQADLLMVVGTISHKQAPVLKKIFDQMCEPKWVMCVGACACSGGFYDNYATVQGIDEIIPVDVYVPGCPPRPEAILDALTMIQERISERKAEIF